MWVVKYFYEGIPEFPLYVFTTKEKAKVYAREMEQLEDDEEPEFSEVIEIEVDP